MIGRLYATHCGAAQCVLDSLPEPRLFAIHDVFQYAAGLNRILDGPGRGLEAPPFESREPTF